MNYRNKIVTKRKHPWLTILLALALTGTCVFAQTQDSDDAELESEVYVLSPFIVASSEDDGYMATSSMAGTRINTNLEDIPASISVVTKDMMRDLGVQNSGLLLNYTVGTEVSGASGSFSGASTVPGSLQHDSVNRNFIPTARVRGLANADNTRDFFITDVPWDGFNTERVEINRGPNSMLFGTGSPAGIINQTTSKAYVENNSTEILFELSNFGSTRAQVDNNMVIIDDMLAVRSAFKYSDDRYQQEEAYIRDKRAFVAATYRPFRLTTIRANFEMGRQNSVKPEWRPPFDNGILSWFEVGMPAVNPLTNEVTFLGTSTARVSAVNDDGTYRGSWTSSGAEPLPILTGNMAGGWGSDNPALIFDQPNARGTNLYGLNGVYALTNRAPGYWGGSMVGMVLSRQYQQVQHNGLVGGSAYNERQISDPKIFDFYNHMLDGSNKTEGAKWHTGTVTLEQLLPNRQGGIEFAYNSQYLRTSFNNPFNWATYGIGIDPNVVLLDGTPNPNFGRPVIASDSWSTETKSTRENARVTAFYTLETKIGSEWFRKLLGTHTGTASWSKASAYSATQGGRALVAGPEWIFQNPQVIDHSNGYPYTIPNNASRGIQSVVYLGEAADNAQDMNIRPITVNVQLPDIDSVPVYFYRNIYDSDDHASANVIGGSWETAGVQILRGTELDKSSVDLNWTGGAQKSEITSRVFILHSSMLWDTILPTIGYRKDKLKFYNAPGNVVDLGGFSESKAPLPDSPSSIFEQDSFNWGVVARLPSSIEAKLPAGIRTSIFYNKSDNFSPTPQRINMFGEMIDPAMGTTQEYGVMITALDNKLALRITHFETSLAGTSVDMRDAVHTIVRDGIGNALVNISNGFNDDNPTARDAFLGWWNSDPLAANIKDTFGFVGNNPTAITDGVLLQTTDSVSKGLELEVTYNPTPNWRISFNFAKTEVVNDNTARDAAEFLAQIRPVLEGSAGQIWIDATGRTWANRANEFVNAVNFKTYGDGQPANPELRKYRFNALTHYSFTDGALKNFGVGGAVRWADEVIIGTGFERDPELGDIPDYSTLYYGPSEMNVDAWITYRREKIFKNVDWELKLNVRNIGVNEELIPTVTQPDGTIAQWRIAEPMTWTLSSQFNF